MIEHVTGGEFLSVQYSKGSSPYVGYNTGQPLTGTITYDSNAQCMKVYDGTGWQRLGGGVASINLSHNAIGILKWAERKMLEEAELKELCDKNPTIKSIVDQMNADMATYQHKIAMVKELIQDEVKVGTN